MYEQPQFEIPEAVRDLAQRNVEQAKAAYSQFMDIARRTQEAVTKQQGAMTAGALDIQQKAMQYAERNINSSFKFAGDLARARDLQQFIEIQSRYAQEQMQEYAKQAQELGRLMAEAAQRSGQR